MKKTANDKENNQQADETLKAAKNDSSVKEALKKEQQPVNKNDLSGLQNNKEIGTTGGDQRASKTELKQDEAPSNKTRKSREKK